MIRHFLAIAVLALGATFSAAQPSLPSSFQAKTIHSPEGADIFVRWGGRGPVVVLLHGYAENSDSWAPLAADLMKDHTVETVLEALAIRTFLSSCSLTATANMTMVCALPKR
jgi:hypothetical protein